MRIVVADDHALFRQGVCLVLEDLYPGAEIVQASTVAETLELLSRDNGFDVILFDLNMPDSKTGTTLPAVVAAAGETPVVVISASEELEDIRGAIDAGARGYILKSSPVEAMRYGLPLVLCGETYIPLPGAALARLEQKAQGQPGGAFAGGMEGAMGGVMFGNHRFTPRQAEVAKLLVQGLSNKEIARKLDLIEGTVKVHVREVMRKLGAKNRTHAAIIATQQHLFGS